MKVTLDPGAHMPTRAHPTDAGLDLYAPRTVVIPARGGATVDTVWEMARYVTAFPEGYVGMLKSKSGLNVKKNILGEGVIDAGYTGPIVVKLYNQGDEDVTVEAGQKLIQLVILPILTPALELADSLEDTDRGAGGFGSTGA